MDWKTKEQAPKEFLLKFPELHPVIASLLYSRKITEPKKVEQFLDPDYYQDLYDPFLFFDMRKAVARIQKAIAEKQKFSRRHAHCSIFVFSTFLHVQRIRLALVGRRLRPNFQASFPDSQNGV